MGPEASKQALEIADRLELVAARVGGLRALSEASFGPKSKTRASATVSRLRAGKIKAPTKASLRRWVEGAARLGVPLSEDWLFDGSGAAPPSSRIVTPDAHDTYPSLRQALLLLANVHPPEVLAALEAARYRGLGNEDPGLAHWVAEARMLARLLEEERHASAVRDEPTDEQPRATVEEIGRIKPRRKRS